MDKHHLTKIHLDNVSFDQSGGIIDGGHSQIKQKIICLRPGHKSKTTQVYAEEKEGKILSHNYGHSGVGYTILFGTVEQAIENFQKIRIVKNLDYQQEITVIGLGVIGLVTALALYHRGFKNVKVVGEKYENTPSLNAGGLFEFSLSTIYDPKHIEHMNRLFLHSFEEYKQIIEGRHKFIKSGVKEVDYYTDFYQEGAGLKYLADLGKIPKMKKVTIHFDPNDKVGRELYHFKTLHINTYVFMNELYSTVQKLKIPIEYKKLNSFSEISSPIIFNCSGLGSKELNKDDQVYPVCGHGFILNDNSIGKENYIIRLTKMPELKNHPDHDGSVYFMPKISGFIGGTYLIGYDGKDEKFNKEQFNKLFTRAKILFSGFKPKF